MVQRSKASFRVGESEFDPTESTGGGGTLIKI